MTNPHSEPVGLDQSLEAKMQRAMDRVNRQMATRIESLRLMGPPEPELQPEHASLVRRHSSSLVIANCRFCNPPPRLYKCPLCDWETEDKWRMQSHNMGSNPEWCLRRADKKARKWAQHA